MQPVASATVLFGSPINPLTFTSGDVIITTPTGPIPAGQIVITPLAGPLFSLSFPVLIGGAAAAYFSEILLGHERIGISSWSATLLAMVNRMRDTRRQVADSVVQDLQDYFANQLHSKEELREAGRQVAGLVRYNEYGVQQNEELRADILRLENLLNLPPGPSGSL